MGAILLESMDLMFLSMKIINDYDDLTVGRLQSMRLYAQSRPLVSRHRKILRGQPIASDPLIDRIDDLLDSDYIELDCAGWFFENSQRRCYAIELHVESEKFFRPIDYLYDYLDCCPTYLKPDPVLAYYSSYFKYCDLEKFFLFLEIWSEKHELIIALDQTKLLNYNYLRDDFFSLISTRFPNFTVLDDDLRQKAFILK